MTNDDGRKPEGAPERSPKAGAGAPSGVDGNGPKRFSVQRKMAIVARLLRGEPLELVARETNVSIARLTEWRDRAFAGAATALKERERDDRDDEIARLKSKVGEITMDNELLCAKIAALEGKRPSDEGGRDDEPDTLALLCSLLWSGARCARVEDLARQRLSLSQGDAAEHERPSPWSGWRMFGRGTGRPHPPAHRRLPPSRRGLPQAMGAIALRGRSRKSPACATGDARERLARAASRWTHRGQAARWDDHHWQGQ